MKELKSSFKYYTQKDSELKIKSEGQVFGLDYNITAKLGEDFGEILLDGRLFDFPLAETFRYVVDEQKLFINSELELKIYEAMKRSA